MKIHENKIMWYRLSREKLDRYVSYDSAKEWAKEQKIFRRKDWQNATKPHNIPVSPEIYPNWTSWADFLGEYHTPNKLRKFVSYEEAKDWVKKNKITSPNEFAQTPKPNEIPMQPWAYYGRKNQWKGWTDFLGKSYLNNFNNVQYLPYKEAKIWAQNSGIKDSLRWLLSVLPINIPRQPEKYYKDEWEGWNQFLNEEHLFDNSMHTEIKNPVYLPNQSGGRQLSHGVL